MKRYIFLLTWLASVSIGFANPGSNAAQRSETATDSVFFSVKSLCNIIVEFTSDKKVKAVLNGKTYSGVISANKDSKGFYDFNQNGKPLFTFMMEAGKLLIVNQRYQFACEAAKVIELARLEKDEQIIDAFDAYEGFQTQLWSNVTPINDKAFYLGELKYWNAAIHILDKVVSNNPERAVAWLNLGDSYWAINDKDKARKAYSTYISLMGNQKKQDKIPERVYSRSNIKK